jgi:hypothetical protein
MCTRFHNRRAVENFSKTKETLQLPEYFETYSYSTGDAQDTEIEMELISDDKKQLSEPKNTNGLRFGTP